MKGENFQSSKTKSCCCRFANGCPQVWNQSNGADVASVETSIDSEKTGASVLGTSSTECRCDSTRTKLGNRRETPQRRKSLSDACENGNRIGSYRISIVCVCVLIDCTSPLKSSGRKNGTGWVGLGCKLTRTASSGSSCSIYEKNVLTKCQGSDREWLRGPGAYGLPFWRLYFSLASFLLQ